MSLSLLLLVTLGNPALLLAQNQLVNGGLVIVGPTNYCEHAGGTDTYSCNLDPAITEYNAGVLYSFKANVANTGAATLNLNSIGAVTIKRVSGGLTVDLQDGDICAGQVVLVQHDGTNFLLQSQRCSYLDPATLVTLTGAQSVSNKRYEPRQAQLSAQSGTVTAPNADVAGADVYYRQDINGSLTIPNPTGTPVPWQILKFALKSPAPQSVFWGNKFTNENGLTLLSSTTGDGTIWDIIAYQYNPVTTNWAYLATTRDTGTYRRSFYLPAGSLDVSGGCTANASAALLTNGPKLPTISCTDADADSIEFDFVMMDGWNGGPLTIELVAFSIGNNNGEVFEMDFAFQCVSSGDTPTAHATTGEQAATITWGNSANREQHATTADITGQGTCAAGDHVYGRGQVDATATTMTPMTDLRILGIKVEWVRNAND